MTAGRIARELWWMNQEFPPVNIISPWFSMLIYHLGDGGHNSETHQHIMIIMMFLSNPQHVGLLHSLQLNTP
jgi:hypothetical protein